MLKTMYFHASPMRLLTWFVVSLFVVLILVTFFPPQFRFAVGIYLPIHIAVHVFSMAVSWLVFAIGWNTHDRERAGTTALLACAFLAVALTDFGHTLSYAGMPDLITPASPEKAINFSLVSRLVAALALLGLAFLPWRPERSRFERYSLMIGTLVLVFLVYWVGLYHPEWLPRTMLPGEGLTNFKIGVEYVLVILHILAAFGFYRRFRQDLSTTWNYLFAASAVMAASQIFNTYYAHPYDTYNLLGHVYRVIGYILLYRGIFIGSIREPYELADRLRGELHASEARLRSMSQRVRGDIEAERKRIARSLHDEMGQDLTALRMDLGWVKNHYSDHQGIVDVTHRMQKTIEGSATAMRRIISDLRPLMLDDLGILAAAKSLIQDYSLRTGLTLDLQSDGNFEDLPDSYQTALYRTLQESLTNIIRHADATRVDIMLLRNDRAIELTVSDNGRGFAEHERGKRDSFGLFGLSERARELNGIFLIDSAPGHGVTIVIRLPAIEEGSTNPQWRTALPID